MEKKEIEDKVDMIYELMQQKRISQLQEIAKELGNIHDELCEGQSKYEKNKKIRKESEGTRKRG